jgi:RNA polymerase sigma factor (sigma-70 family)
MSSEGGRSNWAGGRFSTTQWSLVLTAGDSQSPDSREALATLCEIYWYPIYALVRHLGSDPDRAQDLTQGFFTELLERRFFKVAKSERGRFRSFLKTALHHYLSHERDRARARKRGGGKRPLALDFDDAESRYRLEATDNQTPDKLFERRWARAMLTRAIGRLREETRASADEDRLLRLVPFLTGETPHPTYAQVAAELGSSESAVKSAVHRMRKRFGKLLRDEVAQTVGDPKEIDEELRHLFAVLG